MELQSRLLTINDAPAVHDVYRRIASHPGGFVRAEEEITLDYIEDTLSKTAQSGVGIGKFEANGGNLVGFIFAKKPGPRAFEHVLSDLTIGILPQFQSKGVGRRIFFDFLEHIENSRPDVLRVELIVRETNIKAISFYESIGFRREGSFEKRIRNSRGEFEADIPMGWLKSGF